VHQRKLPVHPRRVTIDPKPVLDQPPDVVLLVPDRLTRAPLRAQLLEDGFAVVGTETWPTMRRHLRPGIKPRLAIVDLQSLPDPEATVRDLGVLIDPARVLILTALGTIAPADLRRLGYIVIPRPVSIDDIVRVARDVRSRATSEGESAGR
jgi:hypothetical protein